MGDPRILGSSRHHGPRGPPCRVFAPPPGEFPERSSSPLWAFPPRGSSEAGKHPIPKEEEDDTDPAPLFHHPHILMRPRTAEELVVVGYVLSKDELLMEDLPAPPPVRGFLAKGSWSLRLDLAGYAFLFSSLLFPFVFFAYEHVPSLVLLPTASCPSEEGSIRPGCLHSSSQETMCWSGFRGGSPRVRRGPQATFHG